MKTQGFIEVDLLDGEWNNRFLLLNIAHIESVWPLNHGIDTRIVMDTYREDQLGHRKQVTYDVDDEYDMVLEDLRRLGNGNRNS